ncbi:uncharacterized protein METZ01_LOCUS130621, partial [marine metagenome]
VPALTRDVGLSSTGCPALTLGDDRQRRDTTKAGKWPYPFPALTLVGLLDYISCIYTQ